MSPMAWRSPPPDVQQEGLARDDVEGDLAALLGKPVADAGLRVEDARLREGAVLVAGGKAFAQVVDGTVLADDAVQGKPQSPKRIVCLLRRTAPISGAGNTPAVDSLNAWLGCRLLLGPPPIVALEGNDVSVAPGGICTRALQGLAKRRAQGALSFPGQQAELRDSRGPPELLDAVRVAQGVRER